MHVHFSMFSETKSFNRRVPFRKFISINFIDQLTFPFDSKQNYISLKIEIYILSRSLHILHKIKKNVHPYHKKRHNFTKKNLILAALVLVWISGIGITAGAHRLWSHRSYKASLPLRMLLSFVFTICGQVRSFFNI